MKHILHGFAFLVLFGAPFGALGARQEEPVPSGLTITQEGPLDTKESPLDTKESPLDTQESPIEDALDGDDPGSVEQAESSAVLEVDGEAGDPAELLVSANSAYEGGDYERAVVLYRQLILGGAESGLAHYNLGNAYLRSGQLGRAIASYRRALALEPRNQDAQANLGFARRSARDAIDPPEPAPLMRALFFWHYGLSRADMIRVGALFNLLFWGALSLLLVRRDSEALRWLALILAVFVVGSVGSLVAGSVAPTRVAVVVPQEIDVYSGTDLESVVRFKLHAGTEVRMASERGAWLRIELPDGQQGWIEREHAEVVVER